MTLKLTFDLT